MTFVCREKRGLQKNVSNLIYNSACCNWDPSGSLASCCKFSSGFNKGQNDKLGREFLDLLYDKETAMQRNNIHDYAMQQHPRCRLSGTRCSILMCLNLPLASQTCKQYGRSFGLKTREKGNSIRTKEAPPQQGQKARGVAYCDPTLLNCHSSCFSSTSFNPGCCLMPSFDTWALFFYRAGRKVRKLPYVVKRDRTS